MGTKAVLLKINFREGFLRFFLILAVLGVVIGMFYVPEEVNQEFKENTLIKYKKDTVLWNDSYYNPTTLKVVAGVYEISNFSLGFSWASCDAYKRTCKVGNYEYSADDKQNAELIMPGRFKVFGKTVKYVSFKLLYGVLALIVYLIIEAVITWIFKGFYDNNKNMHDEKRERTLTIGLSCMGFAFFIPLVIAGCNLTWSALLELISDVNKLVQDNWEHLISFGTLAFVFSLCFYSIIKTRKRIERFLDRPFKWLEYIMEKTCKVPVLGSFLWFLILLVLLPLILFIIFLAFTLVPIAYFIKLAYLKCKKKFKKQHLETDNLSEDGNFLRKGIYNK